MPVTIDGTSGITTPAISGLTTPVGISSGGTNITTYTTGDVLYASATNTLGKLGIGSSGQVLSVSGGVPAWATPATGAVAYLSAASGTWSGSGGQTIFSSSVFSNTYTNYFCTYTLTFNSGTNEVVYLYPQIDSAQDNNIYASTQSNTNGVGIQRTQGYFQIGINSTSGTTTVSGFLRFNNVRNEPTRASGSLMAAARYPYDGNSYITQMLGTFVTSTSYTNGLTSLQLTSANNTSINYNFKIWGEKAS